MSFNRKKHATGNHKSDDNIAFPLFFLINKVFVAARKHNTKRNKINWFYFVRLRLTSPKQTHKKNKTSF